MLPIVEKLITKIDAVSGAFHRLVILAGPCESGKTMCLNRVHERIGAPLININLELSQRLLELPRRQRTFEASILVGDLVTNIEAPCLLMDNIEILFHPELALDPLRLLQNLSRNRIIVSTWSGIISSGHLVYAEPGHPEYNRWPTNDLTIISMNLNENP